MKGYYEGYRPTINYGGHHLVAYWEVDSGSLPILVTDFRSIEGRYLMGIIGYIMIKQWLIMLNDHKSGDSINE